MKKLEKKHLIAALIVVVILAAAVIAVYCTTPADTFGYIRFAKIDSIPANDSRIIHLTEDDFVAYPSLDMLLRGENPALAAYMVENKNDFRNPQPFVPEPEASRIHAAYSGKYLELNGTIYAYTGWIT
ncbi:hypothetical protein [Methanorbis furvi]|uniref:Uncharacterized protein n=1 Tax=Methanorbis furvi TaxID=3028299 RepID=A0AAE4SB95_9EURY|nr:hypothetical protein [Methanocorpusculaceae archaeon Ag1]